MGMVKVIEFIDLILIILNQSMPYYRIAENFQGAKLSWLIHEISCIYSYTTIMQNLITQIWKNSSQQPPSYLMTFFLQWYHSSVANSKGIHTYPPPPPPPKDNVQLSICN